MAWDYSDRTKELFMAAVEGRPGNHLGEIEDADGFGEHGSIACGDALRFTFRVERHPDDPTKDVITDARYLTFGCTSAIASSEALCTLIEEGRYTPLEALKITNDDIVKFLGGLPSQKIHCSVMGAEALEAAVFNWAQKRGVDLSELGVELPTHEDQDGRIVCQCFTISEPYLRRKIRELNLRTIPEITNAVKAGGACMSCHHTPGGLQDLLDEIWGAKGAKLKDRPEQPQVHQLPPGERGPAAAAAPSGEGGEELSPYQFAKKVEKVVDGYVRPMLQQDGGNIEIVDIKDHLVYTQLQGACAGCAGAAMTLKMVVERILREQVDPRIKVISVA